MKRLKKLLALLLCLAVMLALPCGAWAAAPTPFGVSVRIEGGGSRTVRAFEDLYPGNLYLSLNDLSKLLSGTAAQFRFEYNASGQYFSVTRGREAVASEEDGAIGPRLAPAELELAPYNLYVDGTMRRYYTYRSGNRDMYMNLTDLQLMLDLTAERPDRVNVVLDPLRPFEPDLKQLEEEGFFDATNAVVLGDADTGEILFYRDGRRSFPIASVSKLMSWLLISEAAARGEIGMNDIVRITEEAERISDGPDGTYALRFKAGSYAPLRELVEVMLLASSNEAAVTLAAHTAGSSDAFVERMNARAKELGLSTARFYTPNGLPSYSSSAVSAKRQNSMSAMDLFALCSYLLANERDILSITSRQLGSMKTLNYSTYNTNPMVFNVPGVTGLKTGSTNRAGYCLTVSMPVTRGGETHDVVLVLLGAETATLCNQAAEILLRWARDYYAGHDFRPAA